MKRDKLSLIGICFISISMIPLYHGINTKKNLPYPGIPCLTFPLSNFPLAYLLRPSLRSYPRRLTLHPRPCRLNGRGLPLRDSSYPQREGNRRIRGIPDKMAGTGSVERGENGLK